MSRHRRYDDDSDSEYVVLASRPKVISTTSDRGRRHGHDSPPQETIINNYLEVPDTSRRRAASTGGSAQPVINILQPRERSHSRHRHERDHSRSSSSCGSAHSHSRSHRHSSYSHRPGSSHGLPYDVQRELDYIRDQRYDDREDRRRDSEKRRIKFELEEELAKEKKRRELILAEAKLDEEKRKADEKAMKDKIIRDEEERKKKEKDKEEKEKAEFEQKVKEKFLRAGYDIKQIERVLENKNKGKNSTELAIDVSRPTFIKVHRKYLHPDTLDYFNLPWEWDGKDSSYIIIKKYIDYDLQDELFEHTKLLYKRKKITYPYTAETKTTVTLKPNEVHKEKDKLFLVREKSRSPSRSRRSSWMFT